MGWVRPLRWARPLRRHWEAWPDTRMKGIGKVKHELFTSSGPAFQAKAASLFAEFIDGSAESRRFGWFDQAGIDAYVYRPDGAAIDIAIQCKGFEVLEYGADQHRQCRAEIAKYSQKGPRTRAYWLAVNRPIKQRAMREELERALSGLTASGKADQAELLDIERLVGRLRGLATARLGVWAEDRRNELFAYYAERMRFVDYLRDVPFSNGDAGIDPVGYVLDAVLAYLDGLPDHQTGRYRPAPKLLLTSGFGFGKTSMMQALAREWTLGQRHLIYAPAALLGVDAFTNASNLASALLGFLMPEDADPGDLARHVLRDTLRFTLSTSKTWMLLIDGLDENPASLKADSMARLRGCISDLGVPAMLSARDELIDARPGDFMPNSRLQPPPVFDRLRLMDWPDSLILAFLDQFEANRPPPVADGFRELKALVATGRYEAVYGDIPKRPLFLGMLAEDAWTGRAPARELHRRYGRYLREKFLLDRFSVAAGGLSTRPSQIVDTLGVTESQERLILIMQDAAAQMTSIVTDAGNEGETLLVAQDAITEARLTRIAAARGIEFVQLEDVVMHSLLQPGGRDPTTRERLLRFSHRSFQDWFLARHLAAGAARDPQTALPGAVARFLAAMRTDIEAGKPLP